MIKRLCHLGIFVAMAHQAFAQDAPIEPTASLVHATEPPKSMHIDSDGKARELVSDILKQYGLKLDDEAWQIWITNDQDETPNAAANVSGNIRQIYFNTLFMEKLRADSKDNWTLLAIAAHEVGHHLGNHVFRPYLNRKLAEREADYHAGFILGRMGAPYRRTIDVVRWIPGSQENYPSRAQRMCEIGRGWRDGKRLSPIPAAPLINVRSIQICENAWPAKEEYRLRKNRDIYGHDLQVDGQTAIPGLELSACAARCTEIEQCKAFSFDRWRGWCYLKDKTARPVLDPPSLIGIKMPGKLMYDDDTTAMEIEIARNRRFHDTPRAPGKVVQNFAACQQECLDSMDCVAFTFMKRSKQCFVYDGSVGYYVDERADSGWKRQAPEKNIFALPAKP